jgi:hypothetical protein
MTGLVNEEIDGVHEKESKGRPKTRLSRLIGGQKKDEQVARVCPEEEFECKNRVLQKRELPGDSGLPPVSSMGAQRVPIAFKGLTEHANSIQGESVNRYGNGKCGKLTWGSGSSGCVSALIDYEQMAEKANIFSAGFSGVPEKEKH